MRISSQIHLIASLIQSGFTKDITSITSDKIMKNMVITFDKVTKNRLSVCMA
jgi:hypothetical protein